MPDQSSFGEPVWHPLPAVAAATLYHVFGHIHDAYGQYFDPDTNIHHVNAASVNRRYQPVNPPVTIRL